MNAQDFIAMLLGRRPSDEVLRRFPAPSEEMQMMYPGTSAEERDDSERFDTPDAVQASEGSPQEVINQAFQNAGVMKQYDLDSSYGGDLTPGASPSMALPMNVRGWEAFLRSAPVSGNVEDRRGESIGDKIAAYDPERSLSPEGEQYLKRKLLTNADIDKRGVTREDLLEELKRLSR